MSVFVGRVAAHPSRPERLALIRPDGSYSNLFAVGETIESLRPVLAANGLVLADDGTVTQC